MSCEVCLGSDWDNDGSVEFYRFDHPKARKDHVCSECRGLIPKGSEYEKYISKFDGDFTETKTCLLCVEIRQVFSCGEQGPPLGELWNSMRESAFPYLTTGTDCFRELSAAAKGFVLDKWREWKGLAA